jgi:hypothetical protein
MTPIRSKRCSSPPFEGVASLQLFMKNARPWRVEVKQNDRGGVTGWIARVRQTETYSRFAFRHHALLPLANGLRYISQTQCPGNMSFLGLRNLGRSVTARGATERIFGAAWEF